MKLNYGIMMCAILISSSLALANSDSAAKQDMTSGSDAIGTSPQDFGTMDRNTSGIVPREVNNIGRPTQVKKTVTTTTTTVISPADVSREDATYVNPAKSDSSVWVAAKEGRDYEVITFAGDSSQLTDRSKENLRSLVDNGRARGMINKIHVAAWSDEDYPLKDQKLSKEQRNLAKDRLAHIKSYLKDALAIRDVKGYNMAEHSNWFGRAIGTNDAELKSLYSQRGAPARLDPESLKVAKVKGGPEKAVVLVEMY